MRTYTHTNCLDIYICTSIHSSSQPASQPSIDPSIHRSIDPSIHRSIHPSMHACMHAYVHTLWILSTKPLDPDENLAHDMIWQWPQSRGRGKQEIRKQRGRKWPDAVSTRDARCENASGRRVTFLFRRVAPLHSVPITRCPGCRCGPSGLRGRCGCAIFRVLPVYSRVQSSSCFCERFAGNGRFGEAPSWQ